MVGLYVYSILWHVILAVKGDYMDCRQQPSGVSGIVTQCALCKACGKSYIVCKTKGHWHWQTTFCTFHICSSVWWESTERVRAEQHCTEHNGLLQGILHCIFFLYNAIELTQEVNSTGTKFAKTSIQIAGPKNIQHNAIVHCILV